MKTLTADHKFGRIAVFAKDKDHAIAFAQRMKDAGAIFAAYPRYATSYYGHFVTAYFLPDHPFVDTVPGCRICSPGEIVEKHLFGIDDALSAIEVNDEISDLPHPATEMFYES